MYGSSGYCDIVGLDDPRNPNYQAPDPTYPGGGGGSIPIPPGGAPAGGLFNFPLDIMPTTVSGSSGSSYSGLPSEYRDQLLSALMPQLTSSIANMEGNIDQYTNQALGSYQQMMQNAMRTNIPKGLDALTNRGILSSTMGENVMGDVYSAAAIDASNKGYQTAMQAALLKANMPSVLGEIGQLGQTSTSRQSSSSRTEDPTRMYVIMADLLKGMM